MVKDAEAHAEEDRKRREEADDRNEAEVTRAPDGASSRRRSAGAPEGGGRAPRSPRIPEQGLRGRRGQGTGKGLRLYR